MSVTKPNKIWKKKGDDKSPKTQLEREDPKSKISYRNIWRRKIEGESKKDDITPENEEINNKNMMGEGPNKECEIQYKINQAQEKEVPIEEYRTISNSDEIIICQPKKENTKISLNWDLQNQRIVPRVFKINRRRDLVRKSYPFIKKGGEYSEAERAY